MLYLGRSINHSGDTYRFVNLATEKVVNSRDATWLNKVYGEHMNLVKPTVADTVVLIPETPAPAVDIKVEPAAPFPKPGTNADAAQ